MKKIKFDSISKNYADLSVHDPSKEFVQRPMSLKLIGNCKNKRILDVGCGEGILTRMIADKGANVVGYDISPKQIEIAVEEEKKNPKSIKYLVADAYTIKDALETKLGVSEPFDLAHSCLVLLYIDTNEQLTKIFRSTFNLLKDKAIFVSITLNPLFKRFNIKLYNRIFKKKGKNVTIVFLDNDGKIKTSANALHFSKKDYETAAFDAGFKETKWISLSISSKGIKKMGKKFWKGYEDDCPYVGFIATK